MKEFDLEKAKAGAPVCTRDGRPVRIICWDALNFVFDVKYPIIALIKERGEEHPATYTIDGHTYSDKKDPDDLMMETTEKVGWINIYKNHCGYDTSASVHISEYLAKEAVDGDENYVTTVKIEWEE